MISWVEKMLMLIKYFNLMGIIFVCSYIGILKAQKYETRVIELNKFQNALSVFKAKMEFTHEPIKNIFEEISKVIYKDEKNIFKETIMSNQRINENWIIQSEELKDKLNNEDIYIIKSFGKLLGKTDMQGQVSEILLTKKLVEKQINQAEIERQKNSKLCKTMGIISGLGICIILI